MKICSYLLWFIPGLCLANPSIQQARDAYVNGQVLTARQHYNALYQQDVRNPDVLLGLATIARQQGNSLEADFYFTQLLKQEPRHAQANAALHPNESLLKTLLREQPNVPILYFALANLYAETSRWHDAQQAYFNAYTLEQDNAGYVYNLAISLDHLNQTALAAQYYQRALQLDMAHTAGFDHHQIAQRVRQLTSRAPVLE